MSNILLAAHLNGVNTVKNVDKTTQFRATQVHLLQNLQGFIAP